MDYDAFGRVLQDTAPGFQPFAFAGGIYDDDTGLVRFGARDYDAYAGRWTAKDPVLFAGDQANLYAYVANDPMNYVDPAGLGTWTNNSSQPIPVVTEDWQSAILEPGETAQIDGFVSQPEVSFFGDLPGDYFNKTPDFVDGTFVDGNDGEILPIRFVGDPISESIDVVFEGGWHDEEFASENHLPEPYNFCF
jgi:RHS repeat-associated protein